MFGLIEKKQLADIAAWMTSIAPTNLPPVLTGIFFMDGNPLPDTCITFYNLEWDTQTHSLRIPVTAPYQWTFHDSISGWLLLRLAQLAHFTYRVQFADDTLQTAQITPLVLGVPIPRWIVNATMDRDQAAPNGDIWNRRNVWFGGIPRIGEYTLRRVVDVEGTDTPAFKDMLSRVQNDCLVVVRTEVASVNSAV